MGDTPWSGRPIEVDRDQIETLIENNQHYTTGEIVDILKILKLNVKNYSHQLGYVYHFDVWFPHKQEKTLDHISACDSLLKLNETVPF